MGQTLNPIRNQFLADLDYTMWPMPLSIAASW